MSNNQILEWYRIKPIVQTQSVGTCYAMNSQNDLCGDNPNCKPCVNVEFSNCPGTPLGGNFEMDSKGNPICPPSGGGFSNFCGTNECSDEVSGMPYGSSDGTPNGNSCGICMPTQ